MNARIHVTETGLARAIGSDQDGPLGATPVQLAGGVTVWVDPLSPSRFVRVDAAPFESGTQEVLTTILGAAAAALLSTAADSAVWDTNFADAVVPVDLSEPLWSEITRLGFLLWLEEYSFLPLDQSDLDIEIGLIASRIGNLGTWDLADERMSRAQPHLVSQVKALAAGDAPLTPSSNILIDALDAALSNHLEELPVSQRAELEGILTTLQSRFDSAEIPAWSIGEHAAASWENLALAAGLSAEAPSAQRNSVDWRRVPRNYLAVEENTIESVWTAEESPRLDVSVSASPDSIQNGRVAHSLMFSVTSESTRDSIVAGPLRFDDDRGTYSGMCHLEKPLQPGDHVEVYSVLSELSPAFGAHRDQLLGVREATRGFLTERLPGSNGEFTSTALMLDATAQYWRRAANAFQLASYRSEDREADLERQRTCQARANGLMQIKAGAPASDWIATLPALALAEIVHFTSGTSRRLLEPLITNDDQTDRASSENDLHEFAHKIARVVESDALGDDPAKFGSSQTDSLEIGDLEWEHFLLIASETLAVEGMMMRADADEEVDRREFRIADPSVISTLLGGALQRRDTAVLRVVRSETSGTHVSIVGLRAVDRQVRVRVTIGSFVLVLAPDAVGTELSGSSDLDLGSSVLSSASPTIDVKRIDA